MRVLPACMSVYPLCVWYLLRSSGWVRDVFSHQGAGNLTQEQPVLLAAELSISPVYVSLFLILGIHAQWQKVNSSAWLKGSSSEIGSPSGPPGPWGRLVGRRRAANYSQGKASSIVLVLQQVSEFLFLLQSSRDSGSRADQRPASSLTQVCCCSQAASYLSAGDISAWLPL